jgi:hypothetical protein
LEFVLINDIGSAHSPVVGEGHLEALAIALTATYFCWITLLFLFIYQALKQKKHDAGGGMHNHPNIPI